MDITLARTFLAIVDVGNFAKAAEQLYVTQSTVSARVKQLEDLLGQTLFIRTKAGARVTSSGAQFIPFAEKLVQTWQHARMEVGLPETFVAAVTIGAEFTLWERLLVRWIPWMRINVPDIALRVDVGSSGYLMRQLIEGLLDLSVTYTPQHRPGLAVEKLMEEELIRVSRDPDADSALGPDYVYVDWGPEFRNEHMAAYPNGPAPIISVSYGPLALQFILSNGGSTYLPRRVAQSHLDGGRLHLVPNSPAFTRPVFIVHANGDVAGDTRYEKAIQGLREVGSSDLGA